MKNAKGAVYRIVAFHDPCPGPGLPCAGLVQKGGRSFDDLFWEAKVLSPFAKAKGVWAEGANVIAEPTKMAKSVGAADDDRSYTDENGKKRRLSCREGRDRVR